MPDLALSANRTELEAKINALLPPRYVGCFEAVPPTSMGSAKLRYDSQGRVAWGEIWTTLLPSRARRRAAAPRPLSRAGSAGRSSSVAGTAERRRRGVAASAEAVRRFTAPRRSAPGWIGLDCAAQRPPRGWCRLSWPRTSSLRTSARRCTCRRARASGSRKEIKKRRRLRCEDLSLSLRPLGARAATDRCGSPAAACSVPGEIAASSTQYEAASSFCKTALKKQPV